MKKIITINNENVKIFIKTLKDNMLDIENDNSTIFGDEELLLKAHKFNSLSDWEQTILALYSYAGSYSKLMEYFNCKRTTIANIINEIKDKLK